MNMTYHILNSFFLPLSVPSPSYPLSSSPSPSLLSPLIPHIPSPLLPHLPSYPLSSSPSPSVLSPLTFPLFPSPLKGICFACDKPILGKVINALNNAWHPEHFTCAQCEVELGTITFYEHKGRAYCEKDYHELFAPRCAYCNGPILDVSIINSYIL